MTWTASISSMDVIHRVPGLARSAGHVKQLMLERLGEHTHYIGRHGRDVPDIQNWRWGGAAGAAPRGSRSETAADSRSEIHLSWV